MEAITIGTLIRGVSADKAWKIEEVQALLTKVRTDLRNPNLHSQHSLYVWHRVVSILLMMATVILCMAKSHNIEGNSGTVEVEKLHTHLALTVCTY